MTQKKRVLVTGAAGFIGYAVARDFLARGDEVIGFDNLNPYYDPALKHARLRLLAQAKTFTFIRGNLEDPLAVRSLFSLGPFDRVIHLAAQAGVRYSVTHPEAYGQSNLIGFLHILESCRQTHVPHLLFASSSSVYGLNASLPFNAHTPADHPVSLYAATKRANELMAHAYAHLFSLPTTGLRFFTVYGPWGRPDMALFKFTKAILNHQPIDLYNHGNMKRDFTFVDDISKGVLLASDHIPTPNPAFDRSHPDPARSSAPWKLYNIGNHTPVSLQRFVAILESALGQSARKHTLPMQNGDVESTCANVSDLAADVGFSPSTPLEIGIPKFVDWYRAYYHV